MSKKKKKKPPPVQTKTRRTPNQLEEDLQRQIRLLRNSTKLFDEGEIDEACSIATRIRILVHDTGPSKSLLFKQLGITDLLLYDTALAESKSSLGPYHGLVGIELSQSPQWGWFPHCFVDPAADSQKLDFNAWWNAVVLQDNQVVFTRKAIVLALCNKDGGAHIDPDLDERYERLEKSKEFAYKFGSGTRTLTPRAGAGLSTVRQIGYEVMLSVKDKYPQYFSGIYLRPEDMEFSTGTSLISALGLFEAEENEQP